MIVVGGLVGGGGLGYDVVAGFVQPRLFGMGVAAGIALVLLGFMLDRVSQGRVRADGPGGLTPRRDSCATPCRPAPG